MVFRLFTVEELPLPWPMAVFPWEFSKAMAWTFLVWRRLPSRLLGQLPSPGER
jgi:hypothetical protein